MIFPAQFAVYRIEVVEGEDGDDTTTGKPMFADGGDKCTLTEGGNTATFTLKDAVTASTVYKLYDAATDGTLKATSDAVTSGTTVTFSGVTAGTYYMSATEGSKAESARVAVTVKAFGSVESVKITTAASDLGVGKTLALESTVTPAGGAVTWSSDNENVATVENGTVTAVKVGTANITLAAANDDTVKDSVKVAVKAAKMNGTYTLIAGDLGYGGTKVTPTEDLVYDAGNYFTLKKGISIDGSAEQTFGTEGDAWYYAAPMARINLGSSGNETKNSIVFSTTADNSTVDIWWVQNAASDGTIRELSLDTTKVSTLTVDGATEGALEKNGAYHVTVSNVAKGSHTISSSGGTNYIYKVVVTEGATEQPGDDTLTDITPNPTKVDLKVGGKQEVKVTVSPTGCAEALKVESSDTSIATVSEIKDGKFTITANNTTAGTAKITISGTTATTVKAEITVKVSLKQMTCALHESGQGMTYLPSKVYDGKPYTVKAKVKDVETKKVIENATIKYATTENGPFTDANDPTRTDAGTTVFYFQATAEGYETYTSTEGHRININKANPKLNIEADPARVKQANDADRFTTLTVTCDLPYADVDKVTVTGKDKNGNALDASKIVKVEGKKGVYTVHFNEPDTEAVYTFTASYDGKNADGSLNPNFNAATDTTTNVTVINHTVVDRTYKLTYDSTKIKITYPDDQGSTDDKVLYAATVKAEAINIPEGQEFDCWVSTDVTDPADKDWASKNPTEFAMPGRDVKLEVKLKDKTEEPENVTKAALYDLLRNAEAYAESPVVATNADDVDKGEKWVTAADKKLFTDAIKAAQDVSSNPKATQAQVDEAVADLAEAWDAFTAAFKDGTKSSGSSEPTVTTEEASFVIGDYVINDKTISTQKEPLTSEEVKNAEHAKGYFDVKGTVNKRWGKTDTDAKVTSFDIPKGASDGITITLKSGQTATMTAVLRRASSSTGKEATCELTKNGTVVNYKGEPIADLTTESTGQEVVWELTEGTYTLATTADSSGDMRVNSITLDITTTTGGGDTPVVPDTAARTALKEAIKAAKENMDSVKTSTDGSEYSKDELWVTERAKTTYKRAIELAEFKANSARFDDEALVEAKAALDAVTADFNAAKREGTKSSGGSSSSNVPSTGGGTTVKNEDGSKTTTKTDKTTGTVTETTTWPNGDKQVVVTEKDGTKTETVTKKDGTKTETVTKPDGSTTTAVTDAKGIKTETAVTASGEVSAKVSLPKNVDKTVVTIPVKDATEGTVAVIVDSKGNETVIKTAVATENGLELLVTGNVSVKIKDNAKKFVDIADDYWAKGAVDFVSSREIFKGVYETVFAPADLVNRGMMATVLYRLADAKAEGSNNFFDVPDGTFGPADAVTREQMATMLFRYAKAMGMDISAKGDVSKFGDANDVSSWASEAMTWAVGVGLINGVADPATGTTLSPAKTATRAEVATIMQRMVKLMMQ